MLRRRIVKKGETVFESRRAQIEREIESLIHRINQVNGDKEAAERVYYLARERAKLLRKRAVKGSHWRLSSPPDLDAAVRRVVERSLSEAVGSNAKVLAHVIAARQLQDREREAAAT
jgi:hypothetical protein